MHYKKASLRASSGGLYIIPLWDEVDKTPGGAVKRTVTYYPAAGAMRINTVGSSNSVYYILKDHLGSASVVTDSSGTVVGEQRYYPYGETRFTSGTLKTDKLFTRWVECATGAIETGQRDVGLGIYHYGARFRAAPLAKHTQRVRSEAEWGTYRSLNFLQRFYIPAIRS